MAINPLEQVKSSSVANKNIDPISVTDAGVILKA